MVRGVLLSGRQLGAPTPLSSHDTNADSSPPTYRPGGLFTSMGTGASEVPARSLTARMTPPEMSWRSAATHTTILLAARALAANSAPSSTRWGTHDRRTLSLALAGSPSMAFTTSVRFPRADPTSLSLKADGNDAPPRPTRPDASISAAKRSGQLRSPCWGSGGDPWCARCDASSALRWDRQAPRSVARSAPPPVRTTPLWAPVAMGAAKVGAVTVDMRSFLVS